MGKKGCFLSTTVAVVLAIVVVVLLVAEGLLIGFLAVPTCSDSSSTATTPPTVKPTEPTTPEGPDGPWTNSRLPEHLKPISYDVTLRPVLEELEGTYWFYGSSSVQYQCMNATNYVIIHSITLIYPDIWSDYLTITDVLDGSQPAIVDVMFYPRNAYMVVTMESPCVEERTYELSFSEFRGELGDDLDGLYRSEYVDENGQNKVIATTQMQVDGARQTFPCFDEPSFKAVFNIKLLHRSDQGYTAISNMPVISWRNVNLEGAQWNESTFDVTPVMPTYLLAMVVSDFLYEASESTSGVQTNIYARAVPVQNGEAEYAAQTTPAMLEYLADYFDVPYLLPKSDQIAVPDFGAGAMENWGLVIYREIYLLFNTTVSSVYNKYSVAQVIGHELAHQWFGNLVTCAWWSDTWLNEGFASYVQYIGLYGVHPQWKLDEMFVVEDLQGALSSDAYSSSHPLHHPQGFFSTITYSKGASFLRMVSGFLGRETFTNAITKYLRNFEYSNTEYNDLFRFWADEAVAAGVPLPNGVTWQEVFETWVLQMGYPLIRLSRQGNTIGVNQEYFLIDQNDTAVSTPGSEKYGYKWYVPITYKEESELSLNDTNQFWLQPDVSGQITVGAAENFVLMNIDAVGFYRVAYDATMWQAIVNKLNSASYADISPQNRAQLIDDAFAITRSLRVPDVTIEAAFDVTEYLSQDVDFIPWETFLNNMVTYDRLLAGSNIFGDFSDYIANLLQQSIYGTYGWTDDDTRDEILIERMTRGIAIDGACHYGLPDCIDRAVQLYQQWMSNPSNNQISSTYRREVYCTAIRAGGNEEWDFAWQQYLAIDSAQEKTNLRYAMSCTKDSWLLNRYIEYCTDNTLVRNQDVSATMGYIGRHEHSKYVAWSFAVNNWDLLMSTVGSGPTSNMLGYARRRFSTEFDLDLIDMLRPIAGPVWEATLNSYYNSVVDNMEWRHAVEDRIGAWLNGTPLPRKTSQDIPSTVYKKFKNVDRDVRDEDRGFMKRF